mmetsp:Transcript_10685/g.22688  ORF Transcript_10685/g.22688 Transcript_10685/m.22688 type:complete len:234 (-) Transcript_10685:536-1237(-)
MEHLFARYRDTRPLFFIFARPMKLELNSSPYLGVFPFVLSARNSAFSAPRICTVDAGYFARFVNDPACEINLAATASPISARRFGATTLILCVRYLCSCARNALSCTTFDANRSIFTISTTLTSVPMLVFAAVIISSTRVSPSSSPSRIVLSVPRIDSSSFSMVFLSRTAATHFAYSRLSATIRTSSGKCHEYHSRALIANVLTSLSSWSSNAIAWMIMLSALCTLNFTFERE